MDYDEYRLTRQYAQRLATRQETKDQLDEVHSGSEGTKSEGERGDWPDVV